MTVMEAIQDRRSVRSYKPDPVEKEKLEANEKKPVSLNERIAELKQSL